MRIGFDAKRAAQNRTGLGNYSRLVIRILSQNVTEHEYHLYTPKANRTPYLKEIPTLSLLHLHFPRTRLWQRFSSLWRMVGITADIRRDGIDIFHGLSNELPLNISHSGCKSVVTIHDLIFLHCPQYYHWADRQIYNYKFRRACNMADRVIAVSEYTKREIIQYYGTPENKIDVVYQGCDPVFSQYIDNDKLADVKKKYSLPDKFLLYVGSIEQRKNLMLVAKAIVKLKEQGNTANIVAVGKHTPYVDEIKDYVKAQGLENRLTFCHNVTYDDLPSFYKLATVFVYPSRIEGFGIPLLEAISSGVPAIGCTGSCLEEAGGPDSIYVNPDDDTAMANAIQRVTGDTELRQKMIESGKIFAQNFTDEKLCADLVAVYNKL